MLQRALKIWQTIKNQARAHPRRTILFCVLAVLALGGVGYLAINQLSARHHWLEAQQALEDGDYEAALARLEKCLAYWPSDAQVHLLSARAQRLAGNFAAAYKHLQASEKTGGKSRESTLEGQLLAAMTGKLEEIEKTLGVHVRAGHPQERHILEALIHAYLSRHRSLEAEQLATVWIQDSRKDWQPWYLRAVARSQLSRDLLSTAFLEARKDYERVLELNPKHHQARFLLGNAYVLVGQFHDALPHLALYHEQKPGDWAGAVELATCLRGLGRIEEARRVLDDWLSVHKCTADVLYLMRGQIASDLNNPQQALDFYRQAEGLAPHQEKTHYHIAQALAALGKTKEAALYEEKWRLRVEWKGRLKELEQLAAKEPKNVAARHEAGVIALQLGQEKTGLQWLASVLVLDPGHRATHLALVDYFERIGNLPAANHHRQLAGKSK
ncbi:MAG: tetratricopeptide repeat protein [Gemmataceae bacterium]|nr:tetratricopeptide repeat protein [Gemmataceae bacterium]MCI0743044.1 tetratricopeptide repeat protein [Gemmataceae bacterium]